MPYSKFYKPTYSPADTLRLCQASELAPADHETFRQELDHCAAVYRWEAAKLKGGPRNSALKRELTATQKRLQNFRASLADLSSEARIEIRDGLSRQADTDAARAITQTVPTDSPSLLVPLLDPDQAITLDLTDLERLIGGMDLAFTTTIERLPNQPRGQNRDHGLRLWIANIKDLWARTTDAPFTRDATEANDPITPAAIFCVGAFHIIEPDYPSSRILREMKDCIARQKSTGRIISENEQ